jgi:hypothetical protein
MQYLMISNPGRAPVEGYTLFGATSKRESTDKRIIGTFGSGNKHGISLALRQGINPLVFCGETRLSFYTKPVNIVGVAKTTTSQRLCVKVSGLDHDSQPVNYDKELDHTLEYGSSDWKDISFALREFVSNAIDACYEQNLSHDDVKIALVDENDIKGECGYTKVYIPATMPVMEFYQHIDKWFLHFNEDAYLGQSVLPKNNRNKVSKNNAVIYRRGVLVREYGTDKDPCASLFDYNLDDMALNESRDSSDWDVRYYCSKALVNASPAIVKLLIESVINGDNYWEHNLDSYSFTTGYDSKEKISKRKDLWESTIAKMTAAGENYCFCSDSMARVVREKGYFPIVAPSNIYKFAVEHGLRHDAKVLTADDMANRQLSPATPAVINCLDNFWDYIVSLGLDYGRSKPAISCFKCMTQGSATTLGFWRDDCVFINTDIAENICDALRDTMVEELAHHITKATDGSRDFANWLIRFSVESYKNNTLKKTSSKKKSI